MATLQGIQKRNDLLILERTDTPSSRLLEKKRVRRVRILKALRDGGSLSRSEISKALGFNIQTTTTAVDDLIAAGLLVEEEERAIPIGHRPIPCRLNAEAASLLGIEITTGRKAKLLLSNLVGEDLAEHSNKGKLPDLDDGEAFADAVVKLVEELLAKVSSAPPLSGIAVSWPHPMEYVEERRYGPLSPSPRTPPGILRNRLEKACGVPAMVVHHAYAQALSAYWYSKVHQYRSFAYVTLEDEPLVVLVNRGRIEQGAFGAAGQIHRLSFATPGGTGLIAAESTSEGELMQSLAEVVEAIIAFYNPHAVLVSAPVLPSLKNGRLRTALAEHCDPKILEKTEVEVRNPETDTGPKAALAVANHFVFSPAHMDLEDLL